ncbi:MAG: Lrp/AsnC family transcriptional regulator [Gammaproteobacteria bacterium]|nr:Lrp/AsnC family transcriptional regulator [Gammaproteobacteria bacterium]
MSLSSVQRELINRYQGGLPLVERPYASLARALAISEHEVLQTITGLVDSGVLSRFGPIYNAARLGGGQTLAALEVPEERFAEVADSVNALPEVAHNYRRAHRLNMWFVVATATRDGVADTLQTIAARTGLKVYDFPKQHEFYLGLWLQLAEDDRVTTVPVPDVGILETPHRLDDLDYRIIAATQDGLPLQEEPFAALAVDVDTTEDLVRERLRRMLECGVIRRIGAVPNHYRLGLRGNGMTVWDVPDELAVALGERVGALDFVSHSYLRPRHPGVWPYNLFAMVHGQGRDEVHDKAERVAALLAPYCRAHDVLFSSEVLKKTGLRLAA